MEINNTENTTKRRPSWPTRICFMRFLRHVDDGHPLAKAASSVRAWKRTAHDERLWEPISHETLPPQTDALRAIVLALGGSAASIRATSCTLLLSSFFFSRRFFERGLVFLPLQRSPPSSTRYKARWERMS
ncbi:hypothetical protein DH2020_000738 [Rehmannia glutinosa]|uniref:F-box protein n=1 Tax=Rehmannia glutinosa TaxID=99300 RepID=A0ABR0XXY0_REHGL